MRIGGCTFAFGAKPLDEACRLLKSFGFRIVDLGVCLGNTQISPFEASANPEAVAGTVNRCLDDLELERGECFVLDFGQPLNHPDETVRHSRALQTAGQICTVGRVPQHHADSGHRPQNARKGTIL